MLGRLFRNRRRDDAWQTDVIQKIAIQMLRQVPEDWDRASLVLEVSEKGLGAGLQHSAITPDPAESSEKGFKLTDSRFVLPDFDTLAATRELELGWLERKRTFKRAIITVRDDGDGWEIRSEYEHDT